MAFLDHDDVIPEHALYTVAKYVERYPNAKFFYSDEDKIDATGERYDPHFKPDWDPFLLFCYNYLTHFAVYKKELVEHVGRLRGRLRRRSRLGPDSKGY